MRDIEYMPESYKSVSYYHPSNDSECRLWDEKELEWFNYCISQGYNNKEISESMGRSISSVMNKRKRLNKKKNNYNKEHFLEKRLINENFIKHINPKSILDLYCGNGQYPADITLTNDIDTKYPADYHMDSFKLLLKLCFEDKTFDIIDIDPYGSCYDCLDLSIRMAQKGLMVTLGEMGHKRWRRFDFVKKCYSIKNYDDFTSDKMIKQIQKIGLRNNKALIVWDKKDWHWISRVWFIVKDVKFNYNGTFEFL